MSMHVVQDCEAPAPLPFRCLLARLRDQRKLSQIALAGAAGYDHSYISRLESGSRQPTRLTVETLAITMRLAADERDALLGCAGFAPLDPSYYLIETPRVQQLARLAINPLTPAHVRHALEAAADSTLKLVAHFNTEEAQAA